jgi:lysophospholipase L1-like esterase
MVTTLAPTALADSLALEDKGTHKISSCWARLKFTTTATCFNIKTYNDFYDQYPALTKIAVWVDGVYTYVIQPSAEGNLNKGLVLPAGVKTIEIVAGPQSKPDANPVIGSYPVEVTANSSLPQDTASTGTVMHIYGDSIAAGDGAGAATHRDAWVPEVRQGRAGSVSCDAWGFRTLFDDCADAAARTAFAARCALFNPDVMWITVGTNDYSLEKWSASNFGTAYADLLDKLNATMPSLVVQCLSPIVRTTETANTFGNTTSDYRAEISTACCTRAWATYHDGSTVVSSGNLADGVHPNAAGHTQISTYVLLQ